MLKSPGRPSIKLRGVRHNNLKNFDLDLPLNQLIVITGVSGSGKSSLAFDTLFAEGQRRYVETFSPYARQFLDRMDKPQVDSIEGIPPAIAIEQRNAVKTTRSTVGTMTEICDYMKTLWPHLARLHCRQCGQPVCKDSPQSIWQAVQAPAASPPSPAATASEVLVTFDLPLTEKLSLGESLALIAKQGYQRLLLNGEIIRLEDIPSRLVLHAPPALASATAGPPPPSVTVIQDRLRPAPVNRARFIEACEQAYHFGKGRLALYPLIGNAVGHEPLRFSKGLHCARCDIEHREPSPALFSFNHPVGACPACKGFGRVISIDYDLAVPDHSKTLSEGLVKPWQTGLGAECQADLMRMCRHFEIPTDVPFHKLAKKWQRFVLEGDPDYGKDEEHEWPRAWYGVKGYFRWLESRAYKMHVRVLLSRYRAYTTCPECGGTRFKPDALLYLAPTQAEAKTPSAKPSKNGPAVQSQTAPGPLQRRLTLADFYQLPIRDALRFIDNAAGNRPSRKGDPLVLVLNEVRSRLAYLHNVGLGYLTLDRPTRSLSGGETERVNLTTCLGTRLVNTLFVLDEPSVGLHPRDTERLVGILQQLQRAGNTVVVVEHEASVMRAAGQIVDLGPGHGASGGEVVFHGPFADILRAPGSITGEYLSGKKRIEIPIRRPVNFGHGQLPGLANRASSATALVLNEASAPFKARPQATCFLRLAGATRHNLHDLTVDIPLGRFVCVTGVSGSGKTTLVKDILLPALSATLNRSLPEIKASDRLANPQDNDKDDQDGESALAASATVEGAGYLGRVILVDQALLGKTPRSNPAVYIGAFDDIRELFAQSEIARQRGLNASAFSFNSSQGQCERCRGAGFEKIEMQFLSDVYIRCPDCNGRRYRSHILQVRIGQGNGAAHSGSAKNIPNRSIADLLDATIDEVVEFLAGFPESRPASRALASLALLQEVGLGYLNLGQPINTLSGGESQRMKLVRLLADTAAADHGPAPLPRSSYSPPRNEAKPTLFLFDEPTTGLHFEDVRVLLKVFQRLVDAGHSLVVIEHNLEVLKCADWIIDLGPDAGDQGGRVVATGTPEQLAASSNTHTGAALRDVLSHPQIRPSPAARHTRDLQQA